MNQKQKLLGNHQKCWIWGRNPVLEILRWGKWPIFELYLAESLPAAALQEISQTATEKNILVHTEPRDQLEKLCKRRDHQGIVAKMGEYPYADAHEILSSCLSPALFTILDCMQDAHNFGAVVRSAEVLGLDALFIGTQNQAEVSSHVARSSSGAVTRIPIAQVDDLVCWAAALKDHGVAIVGASEKAETPVYQFDFIQPTAIVIGNEGVGIRPAMQAVCDALVRIPQKGHIGSLNAAAAASVFYYEARRQRDVDKNR